MKKPSGELDMSSELEIDFSLYSFIGIEFEHICLQYLLDIFQSCEIRVRKRYYYIKDQEENYIIPDVLISTISTHLCKKLNLAYSQNIILDFKRSIYSIGIKDILYLQIIPDSRLIFCLFQEQGKSSWIKSFYKITKEMKLSYQQKKKYYQE